MAFGSSQELSHPTSNNLPQKYSFQVPEAGWICESYMKSKVKFYVSFLSDHKAMS
jgi:hypothetical protein